MSYKKPSLDEQIDQDYQDYLDRQVTNTNNKEVKQNERKTKGNVSKPKRFSKRTSE